MCLRATTFVVILLGTAASTKLFLNCPGNKPTFFQKLYRVCCDNEPELPNGCECFSIRSVYVNTKLIKPRCPSAINIRFLLYTRNNTDTYTQIKASDNSIAGSHFKAGKPIKFITHGFTDHAPNNWSLEMKDAILKKDDANVILVDWQDGAVATGLTVYYTAAANVRTVGALIAKLITVLVKVHCASYSDIHLIGHSLGAHASGMAGKEVKRLTGSTIGRISGLDPAGPGFGGKYSKNVRLNNADATFVDVIHTDAEPIYKSGFGIQIDVGDVDFYPNGGEHQPACPAELVKRSTSTTGKFNFKGLNFGIVGTCSHSIVRDYYTNSVDTCDYNVGQGCKMGYHSDARYCSGKKDNITTQLPPPYCLS